jgi:hypothetical protein
MQLETIIVNFWTFEDGWPVRLAEYHDVGRIQAFCATLAALNPACGAPPLTRGLEDTAVLSGPMRGAPSASSWRCGSHR